MVFIECSNHSIWGVIKGRYSSIGRATVCGTVSSLFESGYPPIKGNQFLIHNNNKMDNFIHFVPSIILKKDVCFALKA